MNDKEKQVKLLTKRISKIQNKGVKDIPNFTNIFIDNRELAEELLKYYQPKLEAKVMVFHSQHGKSDKYWCGHCRAHLGYVNNPTYTDPPNYCFYCGAKLTEVCDE